MKNANHARHINEIYFCLKAIQFVYIHLCHSNFVCFNETRIRLKIESNINTQRPIFCDLGQFKKRKKKNKKKTLLNVYEIITDKRLKLNCIFFFI